MRTFICDDGYKLFAYKTMLRPDPPNNLDTEWMSAQEIDTSVMESSRKYNAFIKHATENTR